jgi:ankyrin repeat protein
MDTIDDVSSPHMSLERDVTFAIDSKPISPKDGHHKEEYRKSNMKKKKISKTIVVSENLSENEKELIQACLQVNVDRVYQLLWKGTNTNCRMPGTGYTPLIIACKNGNYSIASILLEFGASPKITDDYGVSALHWASNHQDSNLVKLLLSKGHLSVSDLSIQDEFGSTPLHFASIRNVPSTVSMLVQEIH